MKGYTITGKLIYVDTDEGVIHIQEPGDWESPGRPAYTSIDIRDYDSGEKVQMPIKWEDFIGCDVECIVVDGKLASIACTE